MAQFHSYYKTKRGYHPRAINSTTAWTATMPLSFENIPLMSHVKEISPSPILILAGSDAHSHYMSTDVYKAADDNPNKELVLLPNATHIDLYDNQADKILFAKFTEFFKKNL